MTLLPDDLDLSPPRCTAHESTLAGARSFVLDNGILRLSILPEYGGRLCSLFYRPCNLELLATEFIPGPHKSFTVRGGWCAAFPSLLADGEIISRIPWQAEIIENTDERVAVRLSCLIDRLSHKVEGQVKTTAATIAVERYVRLEANEPAVIVEDVLTNRNIWPMPTTWAGVVSLRAQSGDRAVAPCEAVQVLCGVGPSGNELDFGLLVTTPYQAIARDLQEGWLGFRLAAAPVDVRLLFPKTFLPHALISAQRDEQHPAEDAFRLQPLATPAPIADDSRDGALRLPPKQPLHLPIRLEVGADIITGGEWSRPGLQLAEMIAAQAVPAGRLAVWRVGDIAIALKTAHYLALLMPEFSEQDLLSPEDLPGADIILCGETPRPDILRQLSQRTAARFVGPAGVRQRLLDDGVGEDRSIALSPGARVDLPGFSMLATPARSDRNGDCLGFLLQADNIALYHAGRTQFLGEFGPIGGQFHPQLVFLPLGDELTISDAVKAVKLLQPRLVVPLGSEEAERDFIQRCRAQHVTFEARSLYKAEGALFDGWHFRPLG